MGTNTNCRSYPSDKSETTCDILNIRQAANRAQAQGLPISEYTLRQAIRSGRLPCRIVGRTYLIYWDNLLSWLTCSESSDNKVNFENSN